MLPARLRLTSLALVTLVLLGLAASCGGSSSGKASNGKVPVVTSLNLFADLIQNVGGDRVQVTALVPAAADPHTYEPVPSQIAKVADAKLIVINGLNLEQTLHDLIYNNAGGGVPIIVMSDGLSTLAGNAAEGEASNPAPVAERPERHALRGEDQRWPHRGRSRRGRRVPRERHRLPRAT